MGAAVEFLIVGQGLAGTALAWELIWRGRDVLVVDAGEAVTSSKIAAGLVTPITGQRLALGWRVDEMLAAARPYYERVAVELGAGFFHDRIVRRIFRTAAEVEVWGRRRDDPARQAHIACGWRPEVGELGGCDFHGGHLDCAGYLAASRAAFERRGCFWQAELDPEEASAWPARRVIFCQGFAGSRHPFFSWISWRAAKGEILTIRTSGLDAGRILSAGQWLVPLEAPEGLAGLGDAALQWARTGSSYDWETLDNLPTAEVRAGLERGLSALHQEPARVVAHQAAVRPIIRESRALIGLHPVREKLGFFNGLGSKGSLHAPFFARQLAAYLVDGAPIEPEADVRRNC